MEKNIQVFEAVHTQTEQTFWIALIIFLVATVATVLLLKRRDAGPRQEFRLLALLSFIAALLAGGTAVFSKLTSHRIGPVTLTPEYIETPYGRAALNELENAYLEMDRQKSFVNPNITRDRVRLLLIIERSGKTHVLSEANYPVERILEELRANIRNGATD